MNNKTGLVICPETELKFKGPFDKVNVAHLRLTNMNDKRVLFKIKTTAPKKYCVRPNCGTVLPNETLKVMIALQPFDYDPNEKNKHKFMVQSLVAGAETHEVIEQAFYEADPGDVTEMKLRCVFEMPPKEEQVAPAQQSLAKDLSNLLSSSPGRTVGGSGGTGDDVVTTTGGQGSNSSAGDGLVFSTAAEVGSIGGGGGGRNDALQHDLAMLRQENFMLNEQILRLKMTIESAKTGQDSAASKTFPNNPYAPRQQLMGGETKQWTIVVVAVCLSLFGFLMGKFVL